MIELARPSHFQAYSVDSSLPEDPSPPEGSDCVKLPEQKSQKPAQEEPTRWILMLGSSKTALAPLESG